MSYLTDDEVDALQASGLPRVTPFAIRGVSQTQLSVARHYGGCKFNGSEYTYVPTTDELIRDDVVKWLKQRRKATKTAKTPPPKIIQRGLKGMT